MTLYLNVYNVLHYIYNIFCVLCIKLLYLISLYISETESLHYGTFMDKTLLRILLNVT